MMNTTPVGLIVLGFVLVLFSKPIGRLQTVFLPKGLRTSGRWWHFQIIFVGLVFIVIGFIALPYFPEVQQQAVTQPTPSSKATATVLPPTPTITGPLAWQVQIVQDNQILISHNGEVQLQKAPFTIRVKLPVPMNVALNVYDKDSNFRLIRPGYVFPEMGQCSTAFCPLMAVIEDDRNPTNWLIVDGTGTHYLYYEDATRNRWNRVSISGQESIFERDVAMLNETPVAQFNQQKLYLLFFIDYREQNTVNEDELKQVVLAFK